AAPPRRPRPPLLRRLHGADAGGRALDRGLPQRARRHRGRRPLRGHGPSGRSPRQV
ncbi:MAG: hypothetical protein AVDCRST_MAG85-3764, partial [uncultured Solirubrobacteraceae bacterium]